MGLFKSEEEKQNEKEEKERKQFEEICEMYHLKNITQEDMETIKSIFYNLKGSGLMEVGGILTNDANTLSRINNAYTKTLIEQNWLIIKKLDEISQKLDK